MPTAPCPPRNPLALCDGLTLLLARRGECLLAGATEGVFLRVRSLLTCQTRRCRRPINARVPHMWLACSASGGWLCVGWRDGRVYAVRAFPDEVRLGRCLEVTP
jgi:hypothetical protein